MIGAILPELLHRTMRTEDMLPVPVRFSVVPKMLVTSACHFARHSAVLAVLAVIVVFVDAHLTVDSAVL